MMLYQSSIKAKSMTLIEVLITIVVFTVGILVILQIITSSLSLWSRSRNRTNATMLAKEALEMVYNIRDTNLDKAQQWGCMPVVWNPCGFNLSGSSTYYFVVDIDSDSVAQTRAPIVVDQNTNLTSLSSKLYYTWGRYTTNSVWTDPTVFSRYITIEPAQLLWADTNFINSQIKKITSTVTYPQLWWTGTVKLESFIGLTRQ